MKVQFKNWSHKQSIDDLDNEGLTAGKVYLVVGIEGDFYRVVDDENEPILCAKKLFEIIDFSIPNDWVTTEFDGEVYVEPKETASPGFYEDFFDDLPAVKNKYNAMLKKLKESG